MPRLGSGIPLVGRTAELERLRAALARAQAGTASAVLVSGDAGVGKSRLLAELGRYAAEDGAVVLTGRCLDVGETGLPYLPFVEALVQVNRLDRDLVTSRPALARLLPESVGGLRDGAAPRPDLPPSAAPPDGRGPQPERDLGQLRLFDATFDLLGELAERNGGAVLVVEDLHWADPSTRDLLSFLLSRLRTQRLLVVGTYRSDDLHRRHPLRPLLAELVRLPAVERIDLRPFEADDAQRFVAALVDEPLPDDVISQIAERSEGNAFFAEELTAAFSDNDDRMPTGLADVLLARIERLSPAAANLVRVASVAGRRVRHSRLQGVVDDSGPGFDEALREAVQHHVLLVDDRIDVYYFRHALLREAVYTDLLPGERVRLHAAYAKQIASEGDRRGVAAALAHHSLESHDLPTALAAYIRAGEESMDLGAPAQALRHVEQALKLWDAVTPAERPERATEDMLLRRASYLAGTAGEPERALAYARSAVALVDGATEPERAAQSYRRLVQALMAVDDLAGELREAIDTAWRLVADRPASSTRAWVLGNRAAVLRREDPEQARAAAKEAIADANAVGANGAAADALVTLALLDAYQRKDEAAIEHFHSAIECAAGADAISTELRARYFLGVRSYEYGLVDEAIVAFDEGAARAGSAGLTWSTYGVELRVLQVFAKYVTGDWDGSQAAAEPPGRQISDRVLARLAAAGSFVAVGRGRFGDAEKLLAQARANWQVDIEIALSAGYAGAELALWRDDPLRALRWAEQSQKFATTHELDNPLGLVRLAAWAICAAAECAERARRDGIKADERTAIAEGEKWAEVARVTAERGRPWNGQLGPEGRAWLAMVTAERSRLAGPGDVAAWRAAIEAFGTGLGHVYQEAIARLRCAETLLRHAERGEARDEARREATELVAAANEVAGRLGARPLADAIAAFARRARLTIPGLAQARDRVDPFTPRERAVLSLVALGRTNREVGDELYISEKTVSVHLSRIMAKLGASRRAEAVAAAYERGLLDTTSGP